MTQIHNKNIVPSKRFFKSRLSNVERSAQERDDKARAYGEKNAKLLARAENSDIPEIKKALRKVLGRSAIKKQNEFVPPTAEELDEFDKLLASLATTKIRKQIEEQVITNSQEAAQALWIQVQNFLKEGEIAEKFPNYLNKKVTDFVRDGLSIYTKNYIRRISESLRVFAGAGDISPTAIGDAVLLDLAIEDVKRLQPEDLAKYVLKKHEANKYIANTAARTIVGQTIAITQRAAYLNDPIVQWTRWITRGDDKVRDSHIRNGATNNGLVRKGQPYANGSHLCPSGYNCRCFEAPYAEDEIRVSSDGVPAPIGEKLEDVQNIILEGEKRGFEIQRDGTVIDHEPRQTLYS